jgi:hypothetical protein
MADSFPEVMLFAAGLVFLNLLKCDADFPSDQVCERIATES